MCDLPPLGHLQRGHQDRTVADVRVISHTGALDPLSGIGPEQLRIRELLNRLAETEISEVIIATDPNTEGTLLYKTHETLTGAHGIIVDAAPKISLY